MTKAEVVVSDAALLTCTWKRGDPTPNFNRALSRMQGEMELMVKGQTGQVGGGKDKDTGAERSGRKYKYGDLGSAIEAAREPMARHGLSVTQEIETIETGVVVRTVVLHESGEEREQKLTMPIIARTAQAYGSACTYGRRYAYCAALGIAGEADDDGKSASEPMMETRAAPPPPLKVWEKGPNGQEEARGDRVLKLDKLVASFEAMGVPHTELARFLKHEIRFITDAEWAELRRIYTAVDKKETTWAVVVGEAAPLPAPDEDEAARREVARKAEAEFDQLQKANEELAKKGSTPQGPAQMEQVLRNSIFKKFVENAQKAATPEALTLVGAEFSAATSAKWTPLDVKAFTRVCEDRLMLLKDALEVAKKPKLRIAEDVP